MASDTKNVKLGVCKVFFDGIDLGYTQGGVEVSVATETHSVEVDQFGKTSINEIIMGRNVMVKCPLAETTLDNMVRTMPGATLVTAGGVKATGSITITVTAPTNSQTILVNGKTIVFVTGAGNSDVANLKVGIGADATATAANLRAVLNASADPAIAVADYTGAAGLVTITYGIEGVVGNTFTTAAGTYAATVGGANLTLGADPTASRVDVIDGVGVDLLAIAKQLRLHPKNKADTDYTDDFIIPKAATAGALTFAYKLDAERIYNVEFKGYPDITSGGKLFSVGDPVVIES